jgi:hypothetical protein
MLSTRLVKDCLKGLADRAYRQVQTQKETVRKKYKEQNSTEERSEVCNFCSIVNRNLWSVIIVRNYTVL